MRRVLVLVAIGVLACGEEDRMPTPNKDAGQSARDAGGARDGGGITDGGGVRDGGNTRDGGGARDGGASRDGGDERDGGPTARTIPDPGNETDRWAPQGMINIPAGHGTPETAWQVGTVTEDPWYIGGTLDPVTGSAFWVFRTGPGITQISLPLRGLGVPMIDFVHLHDGDGLVFGAEITPDAYTVGMDGGRPSIDATWTVVPDRVYVIEVHGVEGVFF